MAIYARVSKSNSKSKRKFTGGGEWDESSGLCMMKKNQKSDYLMSSSEIYQSYRIPELFRAFQDLLAFIGLPVRSMVVPTKTQDGDDD